MGHPPRVGSGVCGGVNGEASGLGVGWVKRFSATQQNLQRPEISNRGSRLDPNLKNRRHYGMNSEELHFASLDLLSWSALEIWFDDIFKRIVEYGLTIHPSSRLCKERDLLRRLAKDGGRLGSLSFEDIVAATTDAFQFRSILEVASRRLTDDEFRRRLRESLDGSSAADFQSDKENKGRNTQFELFTLAS
jgi:hypothetical protein